MLIWDTETTGLSDTDAILQIAVVDGETDRVLLDTLVRPPAHLIEWPAAEQLHGISPAMVASAPDFLQVRPALGDLLIGVETATYNAPFDVRLLAQTFGPPFHFDDNTSNAVLWREHRDEDVVMLRATCLMDQFAARWPRREWSERRRVWKSVRLDVARDFVAAEGYPAAPGRPHSAVGDALAAAAVWRWLVS